MGKKDSDETSLVVYRSQIEFPVVPLSGNPFFTCIVTKSNIKSPFQLVIPRSFQDYLPPTTVPTTLFCRNGIWELNYFGDKGRLKRFDQGWKTFALENDLKIGDACVFELLQSGEDLLIFAVQILDGTVPIFSIVVDE
ncbi:B3 domain-containing protein [Zostera marina]|uniref:B3 domain-containing protein n=1 Tax=Zostera marina TaxID=29655 RepID=A0A0K9NLZ7_ZOSMR|nr:B3 domain-containing protein [Zostera marina]